MYIINGSKKEEGTEEKEHCSGISSAIEVHSFTIQIKDIGAFLSNVALIFRLSYFLLSDLSWGPEVVAGREELSSFHTDWGGQRFAVCLW